MDLFARIAAALALLASGAASRDNPEYDAHLKAIDDHLAGSDAHEASDNAAQNVRLDAIDRGLNEIADAIAPVAPATTGGDTVPPADTTGGGATIPPVSGDTTVPPAAPPVSGAGDVAPPATTDVPAASGDGGVPATASVPPADATGNTAGGDNTSLPTP